MADPLSVAAGVVGLVVPALHGLRLLRTDVDRIVGAPQAVAELKEDVTSLDHSVALLKKIDAPTWDALGAGVVQHAVTTMQHCDTACETIHSDLQRWTKRSGGTFSWRDKVKVGFFKDQQLKAYVKQLQTHKNALTLTVSIATLYELPIPTRGLLSIANIPTHSYSTSRNTQITQELRDALATQRGNVESTGLVVRSDVEATQLALARLQLAPEDQQGQDLADDDDDDEEDRENAHAALEDLRNTLRTAQALLAELATKAQESEMARVANNQSAGNTTITFGKNIKGMQVGISNGNITYGGK